MNAAKKNDAAEGCAIALVGLALSTVTSGPLRALVFMKGWEWFVTDTFGVPSLGFWQAWGLSVLVSLAVFQYHPDERDDDPLERMVTAWLMSLLVSAFVFLSLLVLVSVSA